MGIAGELAALLPLVNAAPCWSNVTLAHYHYHCQSQEIMTRQHVSYLGHYLLGFHEELQQASRQSSIALRTCENYPTGILLYLFHTASMFINALYSAVTTSLPISMSFLQKLDRQNRVTESFRHTKLSCSKGFGFHDCNIQF